MTHKVYTIGVTDAKFWDEVYKELVTDHPHPISDHIPLRTVECTDPKEHSATRGNFLLTDEEAAVLNEDDRIAWVELAPEVYPEAYPPPSFATRRFKTNVKVYRDLDSVVAPPTLSATAAEQGRTNWAVVRTGIQSSGDFWGTANTNINTTLGDVSYTLTGKNVDVIIHDSGVMQYHPEFRDANNISRVRDIVLDGPLYIDPQFFISRNLTNTKYDGRVGIASTAARTWWSNASERSPQFASFGTVSVTSKYGEKETLGDGGISNGLTSGHGTACASLVGGKYFGLAFECNLWNMSGIGQPSYISIGINQNYDLIKLFHLMKPVNPATGVKNPTLVNGSWGYQAAFNSASTVLYRFRGSTGFFAGNAATSNQVTAMKNGLSNQVAGAYLSWSSSSRSSSTDTSANECINAGVIYVAAAGNNNQRLGIGTADPDRFNYMSDNYFGTLDHRPAYFPDGVPCNHRDWMIPQGAGFDSRTDFHPVICVGAMDDYINTDNTERKAFYSNNGPGIDVWAPADETLAAGTNGTSYATYPRYDLSNFYDALFNGTSAAAPVCTGLIALYLQANPKATAREVKTWLRERASVLTTLYQDTSTDDTTTAYWTGVYNMRGAEKRILYNPYANDAQPRVDQVTFSGNGISFFQS